MDPFLAAWLDTGREEGGYVDNPKDSGGPTNHGITEQVARAHGYRGHMRDLPVDRAREIAREQYWNSMRLDDVARLSVPIAKELFDTGFNAGQTTAVRFLQRCLNVANREQLDYPDITADGLMGRLSIASLTAFLTVRNERGELWMLRALNGLQAAHYIELAERRVKDEAFVFGWILNRVRIAGELSS
jgi:lysozyme family protein